MWTFQFLSVRDAAKIIGVRASTLELWTESGVGLPTEGQSRYRSDLVELWIREMQDQLK